MSLYDDVLGCALIATGVWQGHKHLTELAIDRVNRRLSRLARAGQWQHVAFAALMIVGGAQFLVSWIAQGSVLWILRIVAAGLFIWSVSTDLVSWRRARIAKGLDEPPRNDP
jgi:hypothetical protein